jgi:iron complex outermembrane recepter protein
VYYMQWEHIQQTIGIIVPPSTAYIVVDLNGKSASGAGVDFGVTARPIDPLTLGVSVSWNGLHEDYPVYSSGETLFVPGSRIDSSPEYTADATAEYNFPVGSHGWTGGVGFVGRYTSEQTTTATRTTSPVPLVAESDVITTGNVNFELDSPTHWRWMLYIDNVSNNRRVPLRSTSTPYSDLSMTPRTIGLQLNYDLTQHE